MADVIKINENTWRFEDDGVRFFLLCGTEKAALIDSGMNTPDARNLDSSASNIIIKSTPAEEAVIEEVLTDFAENPLEYDLSEMCDEEEMNEMAELCAELKGELFG